MGKMNATFPKLPFRIGAMNTSGYLSILVILLMTYWLLFHRSSLAYYWNWDDLHLIRSFSGSEITQVFTGTWDVDGIETPGFRPFTVLFNHFRYSLIGEWPAGHRLFLLGMMASLLWMIAWIGLRFGLNRGPTALALLILVSTKAFSGDIIWIADGIHVFQNWLIVIAVAAMLLFVRNQSTASGVLSLFVVWIALWTREDSMIALLIMPVLFAVSYCQAKGISNLSELLADSKGSKLRWNKRYIAYFVGLYGLAIMSLTYRKFFVPETSIMPSSVKGFLSHIKWSIWIVGGTLPAGKTGWGFQNGSKLLETISLGWGIAVGSILFFFIFAGRKILIYKRRSGVCFGCMILACMPGLVTARSNLLFWPTLFFSFIVALTIIEMWRVASLKSQNENVITLKLLDKAFNFQHLLVIFMFFLATVGSLERSIMQSLDMHPFSINQIKRDQDLIWTGKIPVKRQRYIIEKLNKLGIDAKNLTEQTYEDMYIDALSSGRIYNERNRTKPFIPPATFLAP